MLALDFWGVSLAKVRSNGSIPSSREMSAWAAKRFSNQTFARLWPVLLALDFWRQV
jgi:hypothetical protein